MGVESEEVSAFVQNWKEEHWGQREQWVLSSGQEQASWIQENERKQACWEESILEELQILQLFFFYLFGGNSCLFDLVYLKSKGFLNGSVVKNPLAI